MGDVSTCIALLPLEDNESLPVGWVISTGTVQAPFANRILTPDFEFFQ